MNKKVILVCIGMVLLASCASQEAQLQTQKTKTFGVILPMTGSASFYGQYARYGIEIAIEDLDRKGGINGVPVRFVIEDSRSDKTEATTLAQRMISVDDVDALFTITTSMAGAIAPIAEQNKIPFVYGASTNSFAINKTYVFKDYPDFADQCELLAREVLNEGHTKIALFGTNAEFTQNCKLGAERVISLVAYEVATAGDADMRAQFTKIQNSGSTALILSVLANDCPNAFKQLRELGLKNQLFIAGQSFTCGTDALTSVNKDLLLNARGADLKINESDPVYAGFKQRLDAKGNALYVRGSGMMYDDILMVAKALENCPDALCTVQKLKTAAYRGVTGTLNYNGDTVVDRELMLTRFEADSWKPLE